MARRFCTRFLPGEPLSVAYHIDANDVAPLPTETLDAENGYSSVGGRITTVPAIRSWMACLNGVKAATANPAPPLPAETSLSKAREAARSQERRPPSTSATRSRVAILPGVA